MSHAEDVESAQTIAIVNAFNEAFNRHDVDAVMALMTEDCLFEDTSPPPDGTRYKGQAAVRAFWKEIFAARDRCTVRWRYTFNGTEHIRGVDVIRVRDGKLAEKMAYVKG
jgi:ketosteroid isomerase-like protein